VERDVDRDVLGVLTETSWAFGVAQAYPGATAITPQAASRKRIRRDALKR
jgi:hypothetical protein